MVEEKKYILDQIKKYKQMLADVLKPPTPHPYMSLFKDKYGRWPANDELRAFIDIYVMPDEADDKFQMNELRELRKEKLKLIIQQNEIQKTKTN